MFFCLFAVWSVILNVAGGETLRGTARRLHHPGDLVHSPLPIEVVQKSSFENNFENPSGADTIDSSADASMHQSNLIDNGLSDDNSLIKSKPIGGHHQTVDGLMRQKREGTPVLTNNEELPNDSINDIVAKTDNYGGLDSRSRISLNTWCRSSRLC